MVYSLEAEQTILSLIPSQKMMARYRSRGMSLRPVNRIKHVVDFNGAGAAAAQIPISIADASDTPTIAVTSSVQTGAKINGFYIKVEVAQNEPFVDATVPQVYFALWKNPASNMTAPSINAIGVSDTKRFFIHQEMVMINNSDGGNPRILFNGVIAVPKGMRRMGPDDQWEILVLSPGVDIMICAQIHYKEFR